MRIVIVSDTHGMEEDLPPLPNADLLIHCGDFTEQGTPREFESFNRWLGSVPCRHKLLIPGNHDASAADSLADARRLLSNGILLLDEEITIEGLRIYGSPWTPEFGGWSFMLPERKMKEIWQKIPAGLDILITHGPPLGILDEVHRYNQAPSHAGCAALRRRVREVKPRLHCFGHIHEGCGSTTEGETIYVNASSCNRNYSASNAPVLIELTPQPSTVASGRDRE
jgi:Icc-related predicted phosphoesterase